MEKQEHIEVKVYLDTNLIFDPIKIDDIEQGEVEALKTLSESQRVKFYVSEKVKKEIEKHKNPIKKNYLLFLYNLIQKVPEENIIKDVPFLFDAIMFDEGVFDGNIKKEDPLFIKLNKFLIKRMQSLFFKQRKMI